jgi:hypothetical protein
MKKFKNRSSDLSHKLSQNLNAFKLKNFKLIFTFLNLKHGFLAYLKI